MGYFEGPRYVAETAGEWYAKFRDYFEAEARVAGIKPPRWVRQEFVERVVRGVAQAIGSLDEALETLVAERLDWTNAPDAGLREAARVLNVQIDDGTPSSVTLTVSAWSTGPVFLPRGTVAAGGGPDGGARWATVEDVTIPAGGFATVVARCEDSGPVSAAPGTITRKISAAPGWDTVTNAVEATVGTNPDTGAAVRARLEAGAFFGGGSPTSVRGAILGVDGVQHAQVYDNELLTPVTVASRTVPARGWGIFVWPATIPQESIRQIGALIWALKRSGTPLSLPTTTGVDGARVTVVDGAGIDRPIGWWWYQARRYQLAISVNAADFEAGFGEARTKSPAIAAVKAVAGTISPGARLPQQDFVTAVNAVPGIYRSSVTIAVETFSGSGIYGSPSAADVLPQAGEVLILDPDSEPAFTVVL